MASEAAKMAGGAAALRKRMYGISQKESCIEESAQRRVK